MDYLFNDSVKLPADDILLSGDLCVPNGARTIVIVASVIGDSWQGNLNGFVARYLQQDNFGTLVFELPSGEASQNYDRPSQSDIHSKQLKSVTEWLRRFTVEWKMHIAYFGSGAGGTATLKASAELHTTLAVVCFNGRADLILQDLKKVRAATLLVVGCGDCQLLNYNREAFNEMRCEKELMAIDGITDQACDTRKLEKLARITANWFKDKQAPAAGPETA